MGQGSISPFLDLFVVCVCVAVFNFNLPPRAFQVDVSRRCLWKNSFIPLPCMSMHFFPPHGQRGEGVKAFKPSSASLVFFFFNNNRKFLSTLRGTTYYAWELRTATITINNQILFLIKRVLFCEISVLVLLGLCTEFSLFLWQLIIIDTRVYHVFVVSSNRPLLSRCQLPSSAMMGWGIDLLTFARKPTTAVLSIWRFFD